MKQGFKRIVSMALIASMIATMAPSTAWAASVDNTDAAQVEAQTAADEEVAPAAESAAETEAVEVQTETEPAATEETEAQTETEETEIQAETEETETPVYSIGDININFQGANAAVAEQLTKDVEIDEEDPAIQSLREALGDLEMVGGEAGTESNESNISTADLYEADEQAETKKLTKEQIDTVVKQYQNYLDQWSANANVLGVQNPFFLDFNDDTDGLGILGEMLALDGKSVQDVRDGKVSYDDLTGMISTFTYGDKLGIKHYGPNVTKARDEALAAVAASGAQTKAQKLLVLNDWLAHNNTFDMSYIMNSGKESDDDKPMIAEKPQPQEHEEDVREAIKADYTDSLTKNFHDQIYAGIVNDIRNKYYEGAIQNIKYQQLLGKSEDEATEDEKTEAKNKAETYVNENKETIEKDPDAFVRSNFGDETADQIKQGADAQVEEAEKTGVAQDPSKPDEKYTVEQMTQGAMATEKVVDLDQDGVNDTTANDAIPIYAKQAADGMTPGVINYWEGTQFGAFGMGTSVCLGYSKAFTYLVQCLDKDVYLKDTNAGYDSSNWKTAKELYYGSDGKTLDINAGYTVDLVRISFQSNVTMYGEEQEDFGSDHYWNAVKVDGQWYYVDPCYTDVYTEVMSRDRVETDGDMNHTFFLFSDTSARKLYDGNFSTLRSLYTNAATVKDYETAWMARATSNVYYADGYAYYMYDSTDLFDRASSTSMNQKAAEYKIVRHKLTDTDTGDGDSDYETLINFTDTKKSDDTATADASDTSDSTSDETFVSVLNKDGKMEKNDLLTKLYAQFVDEQSIYPSIGLTAALYTDGKIYFNVSNDIVSYNPADGAVAVVKEYNTVSAVRDTTKLFGGMAFTTTSEDKVDFTVTNHPIAGLTVKGDKLIVSIGTNFAFISGKTGLLDHTSSGRYGYQFEETDYNPTYTNYKKYQQFMGSQSNDNDEFMWSANFVDTVDMKTLTGTSHNYETVSEPAYCGRNAFTEERCSDCGLIKEGTRVEAENTAHEHHYIKFHETYYTKDKSKNRNEADNYVCPECGACITEPVKSNFEQANSTYEKRKAIWDEAQKNAAEGHAYAATDAEWSGDHTSVTFQNLKCETCANQINKLDCLLESDENATNKANRDSIENALSEKVTATAKLAGHTGTCEQGVTMYYKAADKTAGGVKYVVTTTETKEAGKHAYTGTWTWNETKDDNGNVTDATATVKDVKCEVCGNVPTEDQIKVNVVKDTENSKAATCTEKGKDVYTATATVTDADGKEIGTLTAKPKEVELAALGHNYELTWSEWTKDEKNGDWTTTATFTCANDKNHVETPEVKVTSETTDATCTKAGTVTYTATTEFDGKTYTNPNPKVVEGQALSHKYGKPTWKWDGYTKATATFKCERGDDTQTVEATITSKTTDAKCEVAGETVYTATVTFDGKEYTDTQKEEIKALGHKYELTWSPWEEKDGKWTTTATFTCANDKTDVQTPEVKVAETSDKPTCEEDGVVTYTASTEFNGQTYTNPEKKTVPVKAQGHDYQPVVTKKATTVNDGTIAYTCSRCNKVEKTETISHPKTIALEATTYTYTGQEIKPAVTVTAADGTTIAADKNYTVSYPTAKNVGKYTVKVTFTGDYYEGSVEKTFEITKATVAMKYTNESVVVDYTAKGTVDNALVTEASADSIAYTSSNEKVARVAEDGTVSIIGYGTVTITAKVGGDANYNDASAQYTLKINPLATPELPTVSNGTNGVNISWPAVEGAEKYRVFRKTSSGGWDAVGVTADTSIVDKGAKSGAEYAYVVRCYNDYNVYTSNYDKNGVKFICLNAGKITSAENGNGQVTLKWNQVSGADGYYVYRKEYGGSYKQIATVKGEKNVSYTDKDATLTSSTVYVYAVRPYCGDTMGSFTGRCNTYLSTGVITSLSHTGNAIAVKWDAIDGAEGYYVYRKEYGGTYKQIAKVEGHDTLTYSDPSSSFKSGTTYVYAIRGYNGGSRGWFAGKCVNYLASGNITSLYNSNDGIIVKWNKVAGAKGYYVYRKEYGGSYSKIATIKNGSTVSYTDKKAQNGVTYVYAVRPYNGNDSGYFTGKVVCRLQTPTITDVVSIGQGQVGIAWKENLEADGYQLQLADTSKFAKNETQQENVSVANGNAVAIEGLQKGETFYFRVRSYKKVGNKTDFSAWSTKSVKVTQ